MVATPCGFDSLLRHHLNSIQGCVTHHYVSFAAGTEPPETLPPAISRRAIQIAGTAEASQIPFFITACDYTLIGEELFAAGAYLSREPMLLGSLKGQDWGKFLVMASILIGVILECLDVHLFTTFFQVR